VVGQGAFIRKGALVQSKMPKGDHIPKPKSFNMSLIFVPYQIWMAFSNPKS